MTRMIPTLVVLLATSSAAVGQLQRIANQRQGLDLLPGNRQLYGRPVHEPFVEPLTAKKIRTAIDDAVMYLQSRQAADGSIEEGGYAQGGGTALAALTMLAAGAHPASDPQLQGALDWLAKIEPNNTYVRGIRANVWEYALRKVPYDERIRELLKTDFEWLLAALGDREGWRYTMESRDWDNSCTQYGVLGIWAAARAGFEPGAKFWITMSKHFLGCQNADGGWGYTGGGSSANMATAGLASMFLVFDMHHGKTCYRNENPRTFTSGEPAEVLASIKRGMDWLGKMQHGKDDGYYLYGIERTGVASGRKTIGGEDWFGRGALAVLRAQQRDGSIPMGRYGGPAINTSFCTLFLVYGGAPVAFNKLEYASEHDWNLNPRDLANLSKHLWAAYERPLNWQTVSIDAGAGQIEAPILFISGSKPADFSEEEMLTLREYILDGGMILAEPTDHGEPFARSMENLLRNMFPPSHYPRYRLEPLAADHDVFTAIRQEWHELPRLRGAGDGSRTFLILSDEYLSGDWQTNRTESDAFKLAMNLLFYATDLGTLEGKFASSLPDAPPADPRDDAIRIARVEHTAGNGHPRDWDAASTCWKKLAPYVKHVTGCDLKEAAPVALGEDSLEGIGLLHVTGRHALVLSPLEREALKGFVASGGTVLVDPYAGSPKFAASAKAELEAVFGPLALLAADHLLAEGRFAGGADLAEGVRFKLPARKLLRDRGEAVEGQKLRVALARSRPAVIFSEFGLAAAMADVANYRALEYKPQSARKIVGNVLAYLALE
ncbi:MAG: DUF4159 domain-containing protein [Planctomycetota bacterium]|jgi:hypothetical protein